MHRIDGRDRAVDLGFAHPDEGSEPGQSECLAPLGHQRIDTTHDGQRDVLVVPRVQKPPADRVAAVVDPFRPAIGRHPVEHLPFESLARGGVIGQHPRPQIHPLTVPQIRRSVCFKWRVDSVAADSSGGAYPIRR